MASGGLESLIVEEKGEGDKPVNREKTCPLLLRVFCNTGRHHNLMDYSGKNVPANELQIYTWLDASLRELTALVKEVNPESRKRGTYFEFALITPLNVGTGYRARDIGVTCCGQKGPDDNKTLSRVGFMIGDFMDISINPPSSMGMRSMDMRGPPMRRGGRY